MADVSGVLQEILSSLKSLQQEHNGLASAVDTLSAKMNALAGVNPGHNASTKLDNGIVEPKPPSVTNPWEPKRNTIDVTSTHKSPDVPERRPSVSSKIILTSYTGQSGVDPLPLEWGHADPSVRGPVVVSRNASTIGRRNGE